MKWTFIAASFFVCLSAAALSAQIVPTTQASAKLTVAILDFDTSTTSTPEMGKQIGEALTAMLSSEDGFTLVDRASLTRTLQEHELSLTGLAKPEDATRVGLLVGAKLLVTGKAFVLDKNIYVTAKIIGTETSLVDGVLVKDVQDADVGTLVMKLSEKLAEHVRANGPKLIGLPDPIDPIPAMKAKLAGRKLPKIAISATELHYPEVHQRPIDPAVETELTSVLKQLGFEVISADNANLADQGVDEVLKSEAFSEFGAHIGNLVTCSARAEIKLTNRKTNGIVLSDSTTTRAADLSENIAGKTALQKAGHELALRVGQHFIDETTARTTTKPVK